MNTSSRALQRLARLIFLACVAGLSNGALAQVSYKILEVPVYGDLRNDTIHTYSYAINRSGKTASGLYQELGGGSAFECDKVQCTLIPPLGYTHHGSYSAESINDAGFVVGWSPYLYMTRGYLFNGSTTLNLGAFVEGICDGCNLSSIAHGINNLGQVVGTGETDAGPWRAFIWQGGVMQKLGTLGGDTSEARAINDDGVVVGTSNRLDGQTHAFIYRNGRMRDMGTLGGSSSEPYAINLARQVVGCSTTAGDAQTQAFVYANGVMTALPTLGGSSACALGINTRGWVVGTSRIAGNAETRGFLFDGTQVIDLNDTLPASDRANWVVTEANGINKKGQIAAVGINVIYGTERALLLTPRGH